MDFTVIKFFMVANYAIKRREYFLYSNKLLNIIKLYQHNRKYISDILNFLMVLLKMHFKGCKASKINIIQKTVFGMPCGNYV